MQSLRGAGASILCRNYTVRLWAPSQSEAGTEQCEDDCNVKRHEERHRDDEPRLLRLVMEDAHAGQRAEGAGDGGEKKRPLGGPAQMQPRAPLVGRVQTENREIHDDIRGQEEEDRVDRDHFCLHGALFGRSARATTGPGFRERSLSF